VGEVVAGGVAKMLRLEIALAPQGEKLSRTGLVVINPPYGFAPAMEEALALTAPRLDATARTEWVVGED
jgi:23S rRNA A2030 N6-methylase RlmJ